MTKKAQSTSKKNPVKKSQENSEEPLVDFELGKKQLEEDQQENLTIELSEDVLDNDVISEEIIDDTPEVTEALEKTLENEELKDKAVIPVQENVEGSSNWHPITKKRDDVQGIHDYTLAMNIKGDYGHHKGALIKSVLIMHGKPSVAIQFVEGLQVVPDDAPDAEDTFKIV